MGTVATRFPLTVELSWDQASWAGQQASPGRQRHFWLGAQTAPVMSEAPRISAARETFMMVNEWKWRVPVECWQQSQRGDYIVQAMSVGALYFQGMAGWRGHLPQFRRKSSSRESGSD